MSLDAVPKYDDLLKPTLQALDSLGGSGSIEEVEDAVTQLLQPTTGVLDAKYPKSGALVFFDRVSWARSYLKLAGFLENPSRGVWVLTESGRSATGLTDNELKRRVADAFNEHNAEYLKRKKEKNRLPPDPEAEEAEANGSLWDHQLLTVLHSMKSDAFERLCKRVMRESGFVRVEVTGQPNDGGIDGIGILRMNLVSFQVLFQAKRWKQTVGPSVVRDFRGAMVGRADKGLIITTASFTSEARKEATRDGAPAIDLVDGEALCSLLKELRLGVKIRKIEAVDIDKEFFENI
ncbi:MAG: restriction endonuclease [Methylocystis sp.]|nr:MAG: restriction endonuclease [Methylocystis sp.]